jgi:hypothetical protein
LGGEGVIGGWVEKGVGGWEKKGWLGIQVVVGIQVQRAEETSQYK